VSECSAPGMAPGLTSSMRRFRLGPRPGVRERSPRCIRCMLIISRPEPGRTGANAARAEAAHYRVKGAASVGSHGPSNDQSTDVCMRPRVRFEWSSVARVSEDRGVRGSVRSVEVMQPMFSRIRGPAG
jgi:hypothetical protein